MDGELFEKRWCALTRQGESRVVNASAVSRSAGLRAEVGVGRQQEW